MYANGSGGSVGGLTLNLTGSWAFRVQMVARNDADDSYSAVFEGVVRRIGGVITIAGDTPAPSLSATLGAAPTVAPTVLAGGASDLAITSGYWAADDSKWVATVELTEITF